MVDRNRGTDNGQGDVRSSSDGRLKENGGGDSNRGGNNRGGNSSDTRSQDRSDNRSQNNQQQGDGIHTNIDGSPDRRFEDNGQGDVINPDTDMRLKENRDQMQQGGRSGSGGSGSGSGGNNQRNNRDNNR